MSCAIRFGTYNIGQGYRDYNLIVANNAIEARQLTEEFLKVHSQFLETYPESERQLPAVQEIARAQTEDKLMRKIELSVANRLIEKLDVVALQEVANVKRPFIEFLTSHGFKIYYYDHTNNSRFSTAIALKENLFDVASVENVSIKSQSGREGRIYGQEIAAVIATIKGSNLRVAFSSLHSWGFQLFRPDMPKEKYSYSKEEKERIGYGIKYTQEAVDNLRGHTLSFIAGDMNNNPQNQPRQFDLLKRRGFEVLTPNEPTNINVSESDSRVIDFIFAPKANLLGRICSKIKNLFFTIHDLTYTPAQVLPGFDFTITGNCSDHKPVRTTITITQVPSVISRVYNYMLDKIQKSVKINDKKAA